jgi:acetyl esterase/lipase
MQATTRNIASISTKFLRQGSNLVRGVLPFSGVLFVFSSYAAAPPSRLSSSRLEAVHAQRIEWMKTRAGGSPLGVYQDYRTVFAPVGAKPADLLKGAKDASVEVVFAEGPAKTNEDVLFLSPPDGQASTLEIYRRPTASDEERRRLRSALKTYPDEAFGAATDAQPEMLAKWDAETASRSVTGVALNDSDAAVSYGVAFRNTSTHILAPELSEKAIRTSLAQGHAYVAHDWLCDPTGFTFIAGNYLGVFDMGDTVGTGPIAGVTRLEAYVPVPAKLKLIHNGMVVAEAVDSKISFTAKEQGAYRLEAWLSAGGEDHPWIFSNPIYLRGVANLSIPAPEAPPDVEVVSNITYTEGDPADEAKHKLDLFLPKGRKDFPVMMFVHGGSWRSGDRSLYRALGLHFAHAGIAVAIPSYRLMPQNPHPAQIDDVAAAFAWTYRNIERYGGDLKHVYLTGHSAGGHLVALLALNPVYLSKYGIPQKVIRGVVAMSGVYDVRNTADFVFGGDRNQASPLAFATSPNAPPFLLTYCQWDYSGLPKQARDFAAALKKSFADVRLIYVPGETHVSEIISAVKDDSPLGRAILNFLE